MKTRTALALVLELALGSTGSALAQSAPPAPDVKSATLNQLLSEANLRLSVCSQDAADTITALRREIVELKAKASIPAKAPSAIPEHK